MKSGIYSITNKLDGSIYIGSSKCCRARWSQHKMELRSGRHCNRLLQAVWNKHGPDIFEFAVIEYCEIDILYIREQVHLDRIQTLSGVSYYNLSPIAKGSKMSEEGKARMSIRMKGNDFTLGFHHSEETKRQMSASRKGVPKPLSSRENYRKAALRREAWRKELPVPQYEEPEWLKGCKNAKG